MNKCFLYARFYLPAVLWGLCIFMLSSRPSVRVSVDYWYNFAFFKTLHLIEYAMLFTFLYRAVINTTDYGKFKSGCVALGLTIVYAISDEVHQTFVPTREGRVRDIVFDTIGGLMAWYSIWNFLPILPVKLKKLAKNWQLH